MWRRVALAAFCALCALGASSWLSGAAYGQASVESAALIAAPGQMAEATIAVDPRNPQHIVAAADPYSGGVHVEVVTSRDGGRTWGPPLVVRPPGFSKSYDPVVAFGPHGTATVVAGASLAGRPFCHPSSVIFVADLVDGDTAYRVVTGPRPNVFVDRPGLALDATGRVFVTWTESGGIGADCRGTPAASTAMIAVGIPGGPFGTPRALPSSGFPAAFGATPAALGNGAVVVAVGEHSPAKRTRLVVTTSNDRGEQFSAPTVVYEGATPREALPGGRGFVKAVPALAADAKGRLAAAFPTVGASGEAVAAVFEQVDGASWTTISPSAAPGTTELLPQVSYDGAGRLWLLSAQARSDSIAFVVRRFAGGWEQATTVAVGSPSRYKELGEMLGIAPIDDGVVTAVPVDRAADSALIVSSVHAPVAAPPTTAVTKRATAEPARNRLASGPAILGAGVAVVVATAFFVVTVVSRRGRRRGRFGARSRRERTGP